MDNLNKIINEMKTNNENRKKLLTEAGWYSQKPEDKDYWISPHGEIHDATLDRETEVAKKILEDEYGIKFDKDWHLDRKKDPAKMLEKRGWVHIHIVNGTLNISSNINLTKEQKSAIIDKAQKDKLKLRNPANARGI